MLIEQSVQPYIQQLGLELRLWWLFNQLWHTHSHVMQPELGRECDFLSVQRAVILLLMCNTRVRVNRSFCSPPCAHIGNGIIGSDGSWKG